MRQEEPQKDMLGSAPAASLAVAATSGFSVLVGKAGWEVQECEAISARRQTMCASLNLMEICLTSLSRRHAS